LRRHGRQSGETQPFGWFVFMDCGATGAPRIRAATDVGNAPMAAAFALAGYVTFERQIDMTWR
jgi:hypothetical protein